MIGQFNASILAPQWHWWLLFWWWHLLFGIKGDKNCSCQQLWVKYKYFRQSIPVILGPALPEKIILKKWTIPVLWFRSAGWRLQARKALGLWFDDQDYFAETLEAKELKKLPFSKRRCAGSRYTSAVRRRTSPTLSLRATPFRKECEFFSILTAAMTYGDIAQGMAKQKGVDRLVRGR